MKHLTWLHLSDWHQKGPDFDRGVVRDALVKDLRERRRIDEALAEVNFVVFSGDLAFSGEPAEYDAARLNLLDPLLNALGLAPGRLFVVPGNHDLNRKTVYEMLPTELQKPMHSDVLVQKWLADQKRARTLEPFEGFRTFVSEFTGQPTPDYASIVRLEVNGRKVALLGLNSAWMTARNRDALGEVNDYGYTLIGEPQLHDALAQIADADIRIAVLHHPFDWLNEFDRNRTEARLGRECHFILRGHVHNPQVHVMHGTVGDCVIIPAGASYDRRVAANPRYTNAYNWVHLDLAAGQGAIYLRRWSDQRNEWIEDTDSHPGGKVVLDSLPKNLGQKTPDTTIASTARLKASSRSPFERERLVLEGYLNALVRNNTDLDSGGIKQTKVQVVLPLDEIYVGLQADRDRPDVDRRVMQEELDAIKKNLEQEDDPQEREKQYRIWAHQSRVIQEALEISGPRENLANIVQRHRQVVILGDPGSGKTTLVRYLTLCLARAILSEPERLFQPQELWDEKKVWQLPGLGPVRLPILLRISHYAEARQKDPDLAFVDYLPRYFAGLSVPHANELGSLLQRLLDEGRCMLLLDGLDEIIDPADRRNIAAAIGQFAGVYRETGVPDSLAHSLAFAPVGVEKLEAHPESDDEEADIKIQWDKNVPEDVRNEWGKQIEQQRKGWRRRGRAVRLAWELLGEARYAHIGNRFVVTSRIAGYHFAGVPGEFEHFTIRRMSLGDIKLFLERWCPAVERRIAEAPDVAQVEQRAQREIDGILQAVETTAGVRRMAENPLLLRILAIIHRNEAHLPQRRVELYETATVTLLRDWNLERGVKGVAIDDVKAISLLGPIAFYIHENLASGFLSKGETERILAGILARERGERDLEQPTLETREAVRQFLETVRQHSGLFVERGEGLYGFMHLTFEEYFTARQLVSSSTRARGQILERLHLPRWREPILLAVGSLSKQFYDDTHDLLRAILEAGSPYEGMLHRDLLFAATCVGDSVNVAPVLRREIARKLLALYSDRRHAGRFRLLQQQVKEALLTLCNDQGDVAVEDALAETLACCVDRTALTCALDAVDWLKARTPGIARALVTQPNLGALPRAQDLLRSVQARLRNGARPVLTGWDAVRDDPATARLLGAMRHYGWSDSLSASLSIPKDALDIADSELRRLTLYRTVGLANSVMYRFSDTPLERRDAAFWKSVGDGLQAICRAKPKSSEIEAAAERLIQAVAQSLEEEDDTRETALTLYKFLWNVGHLSRQRESATSPSIQMDQALVQFVNVVREQENAVANLDFDKVLQSAGLHLLRGASTGHTLAPTFASIADRFGSLQTLYDEDILRANVRTIQAEIGDSLLALLRSPANGQQYQEAALFLAFPSTDPYALRPEADARLIAEAVAIVCTHLEGGDAAPRGWALNALTLSSVRKHVQFTAARRALLLRLLDADPDHAVSALDVLFTLDITSEFLSWCWSVLRRSYHPLADAVTEQLAASREVNGDRQTLALVDEGLDDEILRPDALELLRKVKWQGAETFAQSLVWLDSGDSELRQLAAFLLATQNNLSAIPRSVLARAAEEELRATRTTIWSALRQDIRLVRLLRGLWLHGWDDALTQLWVAQPAKAYVDSHPLKLWGSFRTYSESGECILWLLEKAEFGQSLIPMFQDAAVRLVELEGASGQEAPQAEHIAEVQQAMLSQIEGFIAQAATSPLASAEAILFVTAIRNGPWLRVHLALDREHPLAAWLRRTLAAQDLTPNSSLAALARLLTNELPSVRAAAALTLLVADLPALLLPALLEAAQSSNDRLRVKGEQLLYRVSGNLPTDGSTTAVATLLGFYKDANTRKDGHLRTLATGALDSVEHTQPFWVNKWLKAISEEGLSHKSACDGLRTVRRVAADVRPLICGAITDPARPLAARRAGADALGTILLHDRATRLDSSIRAALTIALSDCDIDVRRSAAYALRWTEDQGAWLVAQSLLRVAQTDPDAETCTLALRSAGCVLQGVRASRDVDVSKEALLRWLETQTQKRFSPEDSETAQAVELLPNLLGIKEAADAESVLALLSHPDLLGLREDAATRLQASKKWDTLIKHSRQEWEMRRYWLETLRLLPTAIAQMEVFLSASTPAIRRAAACALARLYHGDDDRPARIREMLPDDPTLLHALLDAASDQDLWWGDEGESGASHHPWAVKQIVGWVDAKPPEERVRLIDYMLNALDEAMQGMGEQDEEDERFTDPYRGWPDRRILTTVLAELSERLTYRAFTRIRNLANVVALFIRAATDPESYSTRRFAIRALGNLQQLTGPVADVFFAACRDVGTVYRGDPQGGDEVQGL